jgi:hypothetical protein
MEKYSRVISIAGRRFKSSAVMGDIFLAHSSDIVHRGVTELVPLIHEGGVDLFLVGPTTPIAVETLPTTTLPTTTLPNTTAA